MLCGTALPHSSGDWRAVWNPENLGNTKEYGEKEEKDFSIVHDKRHLKNSRQPEKHIFGHRRNICPNRLKTKGDGLLF